MFIIGTAGHIDHGKSSIIKRLTGINPDRLPEEKAREMTIDLGFAWYDTSDNKRIGIVDVPGHERFVRNMIAGAGGIDAVILVVAADDGWMPQSQEHLQVTQLLGIKHGLIALTKIDMAEPAWIDLVEQDIRDKLKNTYLAEAPLIKLSSTTGEGFDNLKTEIEKLDSNIVQRENINKPRLFCDRAFVVAGMGGVATGTLRGGTLSVGQEIAVYPSKKKGKIRTIQSHNQQVETSYPAQRTAASLTSIDKEHFGRGSVLSDPNLVESYPDNPILAVHISVLPESTVALENRRRLLMILGTTEIEGEIRLMNEYPISPGNDALVLFKPFDPVMAFIGDRFIVRLPTPQITVGGGMVLDLLESFPRKKEITKYKYLNSRIDLTVDNLVKSEFEKKMFVNIIESFNHCNYSTGEIEKSLLEMKFLSQADENNGQWYRPDDISRLENDIISSVNKFLEKFPHKEGVSLKNIADSTGLPQESLEPIITLLHNKQVLIKKKNLYDLPGRDISISGKLKTIADDLERNLKESKYTPPLIKELTNDDSEYKEALEYLINTKRVIKISPTLVYHVDSWNEIISIIKQVFEREEKMSVGSLKDMLGASRKYTMPILEETDRLEITSRDGDVRVRGERFEKN